MTDINEPYKHERKLDIVKILDLVLLCLLIGLLLYFRTYYTPVYVSYIDCNKVISVQKTNEFIFNMQLEQFKKEEMYYGYAKNYSINISPELLGTGTGQE